MGCCSPKKDECEVVPAPPLELQNALCPACQTKGKIIERKTMDSLLKDEKKNLVKYLHYMFCSKPDCPVTYYNALHEPVIMRDDLKVPVTSKDRGLEVPLCYCFNITRRQVLEDIQNKGKTDVIKYVTGKVKAGACSCETTNPQGTCCLGNINSWIREIKD